MTPLAYVAYMIYNQRPVNLMEFHEWFYFSPKMRKIWLVFFTFNAGIFLSITVFTGETFLLPFMAIFVFGAILFATEWSGDMASRKTNPGHIKRNKTVQGAQLGNVPATNGAKQSRIYGIIYVMRRSDGILKFGKTKYVRNRIAAHRRDYATDFNVVAAWVVPDLHSYETYALNITRRYHYSEGNRKELRKMTDNQLSSFIMTFTEKVHNGFKKI